MNKCDRFKIIKVKSKSKSIVLTFKGKIRERFEGRNI